LFPAILGHEGAGVVVDVGPGVMTLKLRKFRPLVGRLSICSCPTTVETEVSLTSTTGALPLTTIASAAPARSVKGRSASWPMTSLTSLRVCGANPLSSAVMV